MNASAWRANNGGRPGAWLLSDKSPRCRVEYAIYRGARHLHEIGQHQDERRMTSQRDNFKLRHQALRMLLAASLLLYDAYEMEGLGTEDERASAAVVITALLAEVSEGLQGNRRNRQAR